MVRSKRMDGFFLYKFQIKNKDQWTDAQYKRFIDLFNFDTDIEPTPFQTVTYTIPPGKYFYAIGGILPKMLMIILMYLIQQIKILKEQ